MGLLDDAIREHLDLKRRRGADPAEVARLEHEALGPVRREPTPGDVDGAAAHAEPSANAPHPLDEGPHAEEATHVVPPEQRADPPHGDPLFEHDEPSSEGAGAAELASGAAELGGAAAAAPEPEAPATDADRAGGDEDAGPPADRPVGAHPESTGPARQAAEPEPEPQQDPRHSDIVHQPTTEFRVEDHHDDDAAGENQDDMLEETPDFLQETPEHDRLWFEQRPPRDFDFDG
jgi:hypothetical protein